jgi:hypothetical protein
MNNTYRAEIRNANKEIVDALLSMNTRNRSVRKSVVERYCRDIQNGNWFLTNQGIGVSSCGVVVDGQHRLEAIKKAGYPPVPLLIVYGLDIESQKVVDQQVKRSARDLLLFAFDARVSRQAPSIANCILKSQQNWNGSYSPTMSELMQFIADWSDEIAFVVGVPSSINFFAAPYLAAFVIGCRSHGREKVASFMQRVETGEMLNKNMPEYHLRNLAITSRKGSAGYLIQVERFNKTTKALDCFCDGKEMGVLRA